MSSSIIDLGNTQGQQAENPFGDVEPGETYQIPSVIDTDHDPKTAPYILQKNQSDLIIQNEKPQCLRVVEYEAKLTAQIEKSKTLLTSCNPGEMFPIPSIMDVIPDKMDGPYETCEERIYTLLTTKLGRTEAKKLREKVRHSGWDPFDGLPWKPIKRSRVIPLGWQFRRTDIDHFHSLTIICGGNRTGILDVMRREGRRARGERRFMTIVQRDGGEVHVNGLLAKSTRTTTSTALDIFDKFEV